MVVIFVAAAKRGRIASGEGDRGDTRFYFDLPVPGAGELALF
jgi:hypothetical protein